MAKFTVTKASDYEYTEEVEINTIEELFKLREKYNNFPIIIEDNFGENTIIIYDHWLN